MKDRKWRIVGVGLLWFGAQIMLAGILSGYFGPLTLRDFCVETGGVAGYIITLICLDAVRSLK